MKRLLTVLVVFALIIPALPAAAGDDDQPVTNFNYRRSSPVVAGMLSIIPGLGQVYNEEYVVGGIWFVTEVGLYLAATAYTGVFESDVNNKIGYESIFLFAIAGSLHILSIFEATLEASRRNENLDRWSVAVDPSDGAFNVAYTFRF
jgi:uncharacterized membrane protein (DUF4010 family)